MNNTTMNDRISIVCKYKAQSKKEFAEGLGWTQPYLSQVSSTQKVGLRPLLQILEKYPDIDARWLLTGEGFIFGSIENAMEKRADFLLSLEKYVCVMSEEEVDAYVTAIMGNEHFYFCTERIERWEKELAAKTMVRDKLLKKAMEESVAK